MSGLLAQIILAVRNNDVHNWINILFVAMLAVFWAIGGILKARAKKPEQEEEQLAGKPSRRRPQATTALQKELPQRPRHARPVSPAPVRQYRRQVEQLRRRIGRPRPAAQTIVTERRPSATPAAQALKEPKRPTLTPGLQPAAEELSELISKPVQRIETRLVTESLLDYTAPDELRRAILHYEILGRPLSLRGPGEHIIGL